MNHTIPFRRVFGALIVLIAILLPLPADAASTTVTFILVNDIYQMSPQLLPDGHRRGGFATLAAVVKAERASGKHVVVAHGGDTLSPSLMSSTDHGAHILALTNLVRPDIFVPGNHEFDFGKAIFFQRMAEAKFPVYAANLHGPDGAALPDIRDRSIIEFDGVRIGVTGAAYDETPKVSSPGNLQFLPTVPTIKHEATALRQQGADFVLAVIHAERRDAIDLMVSRSVDLVLSGHNHDLFIDYDGRNGIVESGHDAQYVAAIDVTIDVKEQNGKRRTVWWPRFRIIDTAYVTPDPDVAAVVAGYERELSHELDIPVATTAVPLDSRGASMRTQETAIGDLVADAMRLSAKADAAVMNGGGIRGTIVYPPGTRISRHDVLAGLPFGNRVVPIEIAGRALREALENGLSRLPNASGRFPQVSGIRLAADISRPAGQRITSLQVAGAALDPARVYRVAVNDFLARGGDGYEMFRAAAHLLPADDAPPLANEVMNYLSRLGTVRIQPEGRIVLK